MHPILVDTNVIVYVHDPADVVRQAQAERVLRRLEQVGLGRLSVQSLAEFMNVATRRLSPRMSPAEAMQQVERLARIWPVYDLTPLVVMEAARGVRDHRLAYYDAQLWAVAHLNQIPVLFSEDFNSGATLDGVTFVNPFAADFRLDDWT